MLRVLTAVLRGSTRAVASVPIKSAECRIPSILKKSDVSIVGFKSQTKYFSLLCKTSLNSTTHNNNETLLRPSASSSVPQMNGQVTKIPIRTVTKYTRYKGKRQSVKTVLRRFYRLNWGIWIRTKAGRHKRLWKKSANRKQRLRRHVFTTASQSRLLDTMVTKFWRRPKYYVDDPYNPYHTRDSFYLTRRVPRIP
ncbi:39S ribosomal protein L35, mitochondrial [Venturia canescens]|uniref:39S ribosomal protein L35, mitochondrial n=1 Tax=Venturia canescens TaxID=32260 RepID=UPI001C9C5383|nr:39S ribosomal protein L35, mitochondrial [Venturia canescens]